MTTIQRPRADSIPAVIAACCPKFRLSLMRRTESSSCGELAKDVPGLVRTTVVDEDDLVLAGNLRQRRVEALLQVAKALCAFEDGDDDADLDVTHRELSAGGRTTGGFAPGRCAPHCPPNTMAGPSQGCLATCAVAGLTQHDDRLWFGLIEPLAHPRSHFRQLKVEIGVPEVVHRLDRGELWMLGCRIPEYGQRIVLSCRAFHECSLIESRVVQAAVVGSRGAAQ